LSTFYIFFDDDSAAFTSTSRSVFDDDSTHSIKGFDFDDDVDESMFYVVYTICDPNKDVTIENLGYYQFKPSLLHANLFHTQTSIQRVSLLFVSIN